MTRAAAAARARQAQTEARQERIQLIVGQEALDKIYAETRP